MTMPSNPENYKYTLIKPSYAMSSLIEPAAINASGQVVGFTSLPGGYITSDAGFEYVNGNLTVIQPPDARSSLATAINASGTIVGFYVPANSGPGSFATDGFIDNNGMFTSLHPTGAAYTYVNGINDSGVVFGYSGSTTGVITSFTYDNGVYSTIAVPGAATTYATGINNSGIVIGTYQLSASQFEISGNFIYDHGTYTTVASPGVNRIGTLFGFGAINNNGEIIGNTLMAGTRVGFIYDKGAYTILAAPNATLTNASGINDRGGVIGRFSDANGDHAFVYDNGSFTQLDVPGALSTEGDAINDRGQVTGTYRDATGNFAFIATPTDDGQSWSFLKNAGCDLGDFQYGVDGLRLGDHGSHVEHHGEPAQGYNRGFNAAPDTDGTGLFSATQNWHHI